MNLQSLEYLIQISRDLNITKSAEKLHVTQQCLSGHVKRLEEYYGVQIFDRKPQLRLTEEGRAVLAFAEKTQHLESQLFDTLYMVSARKKGHILLGITPARSEYLAPKLLAEYTKTHPHVIVELCETSTVDISRMLMNESMDCYIGVHEGAAPNLVSHLLRHEQVYLVISNELLYSQGSEIPLALKWQMETYGGITLHELGNFPFLLHTEGNRMQMIESACFVEAGIEPRVRMISQSSPTLLHMCYQGQGACIANAMNLEAVKTDTSVSFFPIILDGKKVYHEICLLYRKQNRYAPYFEDFVRMVRETITEEKKEFSVQLDEMSIIP